MTVQPKFTVVVSITVVFHFMICLRHSVATA